MREIASRKDEPAWLAARRLYLTATDAAAIYGVSPWRTELQVQLEKGVHEMGELLEIADEDQAPEPERYYWGRTLEPVVLDEYEKRQGALLYRPEMLFAHDSQPIAATPDAITYAVADKFSRMAPERAIEAKLDRYGSPQEWRDELPAHYRVQALHQAAVLGVYRVDFAVLFGAHEFDVFPVEFSEGEIASHRGMCADWWDEHVTRRVPCAPGARDTSLLKRLFPDAAPGMQIELPVEAVGMYAELEQLSAAVKPLEERQDEIKNQVRAWMGVAETAWLPDGSGRGWANSTVTRTTCNWSKKEPVHDVVESLSRRLAAKKARRA